MGGIPPIGYESSAVCLSAVRIVSYFSSESGATVERLGPMTDSDLNSYFANRTWQGCDGAYAILEDGDPYVRVVRGSVSNVIGLSMERLEKMLAWLAR